MCRQYSWQSVQYQMSSQVWQKFVRRCRVSASSPGRRSFPELAKSAKRRSPSCPAVTSPRTRWPISASGGMRVEFTWRKVTARMTQSSRMFSSTPTPHLCVRPEHLHSPLGVRHPRGSRQDPYPRGSCQDLLRRNLRFPRHLSFESLASSAISAWSASSRESSRSFILKLNEECVGSWLG